jgi:hypothetical protein
MLRLCPAARPVIPGLTYRWVYPGGFSAIRRTNAEKSVSAVAYDLELATDCRGWFRGT